VRVKVSVIDISKIPANKLFQMEQCFFLIDFSVENEGDAIEVDDDCDDPDQNDTKDKLEEEDLGEDFHALEKSKKNGGSNRMETNPTTHGAAQGDKTVSRNVDHNSIPKDFEESVRNKVFDMEQSHVPAHAMVLRSVEDNIKESLRQKFDADSDEETEKAKTMRFKSLSKRITLLDLCHLWPGKRRKIRGMFKQQGCVVGSRGMGDLLSRKLRSLRSQKIWKSQKVIIRFMGFLILLLLLKTKYYFKKLNVLALALAISL
jgi:hypothetical protein